MLRKLIRVLVIAVVVAGATASFALAEAEWFMGKVKSVDTANGAISITTEDEQTKNFSVAKKELLKDVKPGHEVELQVVDGKVQSLENYSSN